LKLLVSPLSKAAYFAELESVARAEFKAFFPSASCDFLHLANFHFLETDLDEGHLDQCARLSFFQGAFNDTAAGDLTPLQANAKYLLPEAFIYGAKYAGKTNELLTQLLINLALVYGLELQQEVNPGHKLRLLDPMAGRGSSLFWAARYGIDALGIEQDDKALSAFELHGKKTCKLQRVKHKYSHGTLGGASKAEKATKAGESGRSGRSGKPSKSNKSTVPKFSQFNFADSKVRLVQGDSRQADKLVSNKTFDLVVSDLPYGVQHFTTSGTRNPLAVLQECLPAWKQCLSRTGAIVLSFNSYQPKRDDLVAVALEQGLVDTGFSAAHRMSEAIMRDVIILKKQ